MPDPLLEVGLAVVGATTMAYLARLFKQPMILGYILAGFIIGPFALGLVSNTNTIALLSELGIAFVLFIVGLELDVKRLKDCGVKAGIMGVAQVAVTAVAGYLLSTLFGFSWIESLYIAIALTFSSTMIVVKLFIDRGILDTLQGRLVIGMLLVQDIIAIIILAALPSLSNMSLGFLASSLGKGLLLFAVVIIAARTIIPFVMDRSAKSTELLFLSSVALLFSFGFFAQVLGYSIAIGSFLAGLCLASSKYKLLVVSRVKSLRDFFATIFFVSLGMQLSFPSLGEVWLPALAFSLFVIVGNPIIVMLSGMVLGYNRRISLMSGLPMGQISEFSLIVVALGVGLGHIGNTISAIIISVAAITTVTTTYVIKYDEKIYQFVSSVFRFPITKPVKNSKNSNYKVVLCGYNRIGYSIANKLRDLNKPFVVVDFDPDVIRSLKSQKIPAIYGDIGDTDFLNSIGIQNAQLVVSTVPTLHENKILINLARQSNAIAIVTSNHLDTALKLYDLGAHYVILPHFLGGEYVAMLLDKFGHMPSMMEHKFKHIRELHQRKLMGHVHPVV